MNYFYSEIGLEVNFLNNSTELQTPNAQPLMVIFPFEYRLLNKPWPALHLLCILSLPRYKGRVVHDKDEDGDQEDAGDVAEHDLAVEVLEVGHGDVHAEGDDEKDEADDAEEREDVVEDLPVTVVAGGAVPGWRRDMGMYNNIICTGCISKNLTLRILPLKKQV